MLNVGLRGASSSMLMASKAAGPLSRSFVPALAAAKQLPQSTSIVRCSPLLQRHISSSARRLNTSQPSPRATQAPSSAASSPAAATPPTQHSTLLASYLGPMSKTFYRLKLFSMTSLLFASSLTPVFLLAPAADVTLAARVGIVCMALGTSGVSTALVAWIGAPYVGRMGLVRRGQEEGAVIEANTLTWRLRPLQTTIVRPELIRPTSRPFANWELPEEPGVVEGLEDILAKSSSTATASASASSQQRRFLVAETKDLKTDRVVGAWWGTVDEAGQVKCMAEGKPVRHFQVHEELLGDEWRILN